MSVAEPSYLGFVQFYSTNSASILKGKALITYIAYAGLLIFSLHCVADKKQRSYRGPISTNFKVEG